jgi:hypothetical protein
MTKKDLKNIYNINYHHNASQSNILKENGDTDYGNSNKNVGKSSKKNNDIVDDHNESQKLLLSDVLDSCCGNSKKSSETSSNNYIYKCDVCNYTTIRDSQRKRHETTRKHKLYKLLMIEKMNEPECELQNVNICECGKKYAFASGLCLHKKTCIYLKNKSAEDCSNKIIMKLLKDNEEMKQIIIEQHKQQTQIMMQQQQQHHQQQQQQHQQQQQQQQIMEMLPKICIGNITTNTTNIKQKFNLNLFLNEQCKDAISLCDFVKSLKITYEDLNTTREKNLEESVGSIFLRGLKDLDIFKRPIHCTDTKRDIMYIKDEDIWKKDEGNEKIKNSINEISRKQVKILKEMKDSDPEIKTNELKRDDFILTMNHVCTPIPDSGEKRLIKTISKEVIVTL